MTKGTHLLRSALLALLALAVISGGSLAAGDLFDDDYSDCPQRTRLRDGQISDLSVARDSEEEDEVNVSWAATDPATWGLGANAYSTSLVVILDDGGPLETKTLSLGSRSTTFDGVETGTEVQVQMAIVVDSADGDYLISDILDKSINQSVTEPAFMASVRRVTAPAAGADTPDDATDDIAEISEAINGDFYYVGYNENFGNYKADTYTFLTTPTTPRLRIGLANTELNDDDVPYASDAGPYDDVGFDAYILRIVDEDGDVVPEGDDIATRANNYGTNRLSFGVMGAAADNPSSDIAAFSNVRINDGGDIQPAVHDGGTPPTGGTLLATTPAGIGLSNVGVAAVAGAVIETVFVDPPHEYRDFPVDALASDETYTITAWAINDDDEVISPVATLKLRPIDELETITAALDDYQEANAAPSAGDAAATPPVPVSNTIYVTEFTVLK